MYFSTILVCCFTLVVAVAARDQFVLDKRWVCGVKRSCLDCLRFPHCSWCETENKCFSRALGNYSCKNETIDHVDYGLSLIDNAECSCARGKIDLQCYPPGVTEGPQCSGRGECICGHCFCFSALDDDNQHTTKTIMGDYCEFDNFSCDGPKCNEGPYLLSQNIPVTDDDVNTDAK